MKETHKYNFGIIGNCAYNALVGLDGNIKWMCWPRFDSSFIFGSLLDEERGGHFFVKPQSDYKSSQIYLDNTNILVTKFKTEDGEFEVYDFAPRFHKDERFHKPLMLFRKIRRISGKPKIIVKCEPRGDYGKVVPETALGSNHIRFTGLKESVRLTTDVPLTYILESAPFALNQDFCMVLSWGIPLEGPLVSTCEEFFLKTKNYWQTWVEHCTLPRVYQKQVIRSALTLKLHQYEDTGGVIAACTTSLPEYPGAGRNWDYRFCWLRDTYYTLTALRSLGHFEELEKHAQFIENLEFSGKSKLQPLYKINGQADLTEIELSLSGYLGNRPVRIGNGAGLQIQHDAFGQALLTLFQLYSDQRLLNRHDKLSINLVRLLMNSIEETLEEPDNGIWEFRGKKSLHGYTLLFQWAGSAAAKKIAEIVGLADLNDQADRCMHRAHELIERCYCEKKGAYAQAVGASDLDASMLQLIPLGFFHNKSRERAIQHLRAIEKELHVKDGLLHRYRHEDDFGFQEVGFLVCSFWHVEALVSLGLIEEAQSILDKLIKTQNHLGLMSEDVDTSNGSQWGNFPQTYSHVGLINCAFALDKAIQKPSFLF